MFDIARIEASELIAQIDFHESLGSTNDRALELAAEGQSRLPLLVLAERQTSGRGRGTNRWWTTDGALIFSLVLATEGLPPNRWPQAALVAGLAVCEALQTQLPRGDYSVKWPNDVYLDGRKVCGILSESVPGWRDRLTIGIGINVNNRLPPGDRAGWEKTATTMIESDNTARDLTAVLLAVLDRFDLRWQEFLKAGFAALTEDYRGHCFLSGRVVTIEQPGGQRIIGACRGVNPSGALMLETAAGSQAIVSGTIVHWESK